GARHALEVVVLGDPVALVAPALGAPRELPRSCESLRRIAALGIRRQIQDGQGCLAWRHLCVPAGFPTSREWRNGKRQPEAAVLFSAGEAKLSRSRGSAWPARPWGRPSLRTRPSGS